MSPLRVGVAGLVLAAGCIGSSIGSDVSAVRHMAGGVELADLADDEVDLDERAMVPREGPLDVEQAVRTAFLNNRELRAQLRELGVVRGDIMQAGVLANPTVEVELLPERNTAVEIRVEYDVTSLVLAPLRGNAHAPDLDSARARVAGATLALGYEVRSAFYAVQAAQAELEIGQRMLDAFAAGRDAAAALREAGNSRALDEVGHRLSFERARLTVAELELALLERREALQRLLGLHGGETAWMVDSALAPPPTDVEIPADLEKRAIESSLDLLAMRGHLEGIARRLDLAHAEGWIPEIALDVHVLEGAPSDGATATDNATRVGAGVSVGVPLFDTRQGSARARQAEFDAAMERYQGIAIDVRSAARVAASRTRSFHARARHLNDVVLPAAREVLEQTVLQYDGMQVGVFALLSARRELMAVEVDVVQATEGYSRARASLDALLAGKRVDAPMASQGSMMMDPGSAPDGGH